MSEIVFMIKCIKCKSEFNQGDTNRRFCLLCRHTKDEAQRERAHIKREIKRHIAKNNPVFYDRHCPVCDREFRTKIKNKEFCTKLCCKRIKTFPVQIDNVEDNLKKIEERIVKINLRYEKKMNVLGDQLDWMNFELEKQRLKYKLKFEFLKNVMNK
tara:strand:- start:684 stop:1151 length:468 start_codon:yes stop_codon:yes gene_type:complete